MSDRYMYRIQSSPNRHNVGFSREPGWRGPCPARGVTTGVVGWKLSLERLLYLSNNRTMSPSICFRLATGYDWTRWYPAVLSPQPGRKGHTTQTNSSPPS